MSKAGQHYRSETIVVPAGSAAAPGRSPVTIRGDWLYLLYSSLSINVSFDGGPPVPMWKGVLYRLPFERFDFVNTSGGNVSVQYIVGTGAAPDFPNIDKRCTQLTAYPFISCGAGVVTAIKSGSSTYVAGWLSIPATEANDVQIAGGSMNATSGAWLPRGFPPVRIPLLDGIYIYNPGAAAVKVYSAFEIIT